MMVSELLMVGSGGRGGQKRGVGELWPDYQWVNRIV